jgi:hypothetical protein
MRSRTLHAFVKNNPVKHALVRHALVKHALVKHALVKHVLALSFACLSLPLCATNLTSADSPETVLRESYQRMKASDWAGAAETFDPAALKQFREMLAPVLEAGEGAGMRAVFFGADKTPESLKTMSDQDFFSALIANMMGLADGSLDGQEVIGGVAEGPERMHMVVRSKASAMGITLTQMEVVTLNKTPNGWRLALSGKMEGMAQAMKLMQSQSQDNVKPEDNPKSSDSSP